MSEHICRHSSIRLPARFATAMFLQAFPSECLAPRAWPASCEVTYEIVAYVADGERN
jgi:hypothetical protein